MFDDTDYPGDLIHKKTITKEQIEERNRQLEEEILNQNKKYSYSPGVILKVDRKQVDGKPNPLRMPYEALVAYSQVSDNGNDKYGNRDSWKHSTNGVEVYSNAAARHLFQAIIDPIDKESGLPHLNHALWSIAAALWHYEQAKLKK